MEVIDSVLSVFSNVLFYGMLLVVGLMFLSVLGTVGLGLIVVYALHHFNTTVIEPLLDHTGKVVDYYVFETDVNVNGISEKCNVWYVIDSKGEFAGVHYVVLAAGPDVTASLPAHEMERIADIAVHAWETLNAKL